MLALEKLGCFLFLGYLSLFDIKTKRLPDTTIFLGLAAAVLMRIVSKGLPMQSYIIATVVGLMFVLISYFTKEKIGYGDSLIILAVGILLGVENLLFIICASLVMCSLTGIVIIIMNNFRGSFTLPFVPFIFAAFILLIGFQGCSV